MTFSNHIARTLRDGRIWHRMVSERGLLTTAEAKSLLSITGRHLYRLIGKKFNPVRRKRRLYFPASQIVRFLQTKAKTPRMPGGWKEVISMATKQELEQRVSELEEGLEQARDLIDQVLGTEEVDESDDDAA